MIGEMCQICRTPGNDRRTLALRYFYELQEVSDLFAPDPATNLYTIRTCKGCRAVFLDLLRQWITSGGRLAHRNLNEDGIECITLEEWQRRQEGGNPL